MIIPYRYKYLELLVWLAITLVLLWVVLNLIFPLKTPVEGSYGLWEAVLEPATPPYYPYVYTNGSLIEKLADCESTNNPEAINWNDNGSPSYGLLQFKAKTFQYYCVDKYGMIDDIMDPEIQKECCDRLINDGGLRHWSCSLTI